MYSEKLGCQRKMGSLQNFAMFPINSISKRTFMTATTILRQKTFIHKHGPTKKPTISRCHISSRPDKNQQIDALQESKTFNSIIYLKIKFRGKLNSTYQGICRKNIPERYSLKTFEFKATGT